MKCAYRRGEADRLVWLVMGGNFAKEFPHGIDRWMRLGELRLSEIDLNPVETAVHVRDLEHGIPAFVSLRPAIAIG